MPAALVPSVVERLENVCRLGALKQKVEEEAMMKSHEYPLSRMLFGTRIFMALLSPLSWMLLEGDILNKLFQALAARVWVHPSQLSSVMFCKAHLSKLSAMLRLLVRYSA